ncbi:MAG: hypothetical protein AAGA54_08635 [Myxococcota bacterium]
MVDVLSVVDSSADVDALPVVPVVEPVARPLESASSTTEFPHPSVTRRVTAEIVLLAAVHIS